MTAVAVVIPFRSDDPERLRIMDWVARRWVLLYPELALVIMGDGSESGSFNRSRAVNRAVAATDADVVIVADADIAVRGGQPEMMLQALTDGAPWVVGYERMVHLLASPTADVLGYAADQGFPNPTPPTVVRYKSTASVCGLLALRRDEFQTSGGFDERFCSWGTEDVAFAIKCDTILGPHVRTPGDAIHLFHALRPDRKRDSDAVRNQALGMRYEKANGDPTAMTLLVRESLNVAAW